MPSAIEHVRPPRPLRFLANDPEWEMGQSTRHFKLCVFLWEALRRVVGPGSTVGADNFIYFDGSNADRKCAPDAFVRLGAPAAEFSSWAGLPRHRRPRGHLLRRRLGRGHTAARVAPPA